MPKKLISVTDITEYLYCPRKVYLRLVKNIKQQPTRQMILGFLRHKVIEIFNKNESALVSSIDIPLEEKTIKQLYEKLLSNITKATLNLNTNLVDKFKIDSVNFSDSIKQTLSPEISLRVPVIAKTLNQNFFGKELWDKLSPKYISELKIESPSLGLKGRIDRIKINSKITPYEIKSREQSYDSDKIQLAAYALLLEEKFKTKIDSGTLELLGKTEEVILDKEIKERVLELAEEIRNLSENPPPPMLSNFNKCKSCTLRVDC